MLENVKYCCYKVRFELDPKNVSLNKKMNPGKSKKLIEHDDEQNLIFNRLHCAEGVGRQDGSGGETR